ncbi:polymerase [Citrobacter koseri]|nr:polymerase [Citrobacter koseri]ATF96435.1 polymerase [Citrobacter koseri]AVE60769.1 polymerase [Citrobacter koseri]AVE67632.1 polymerase [Citrobacter koseri]PNN14713.1 polymerase [Citrobacter koseri]
MKFTDLSIHLVAKTRSKVYRGSENRQRDEFTCVDHFPSPLAML